MSDKSDLLLLLLYLSGKVRGKTRLFKMVYIAQEELKRTVARARTTTVPLDYYVFYAHHYGAYSKEMESDLHELENQGFAERELSTSSSFEVNTYSLTPRGIRKVRDSRLPKEAIAAVGYVVGKYRDIPLTWLLREVYNKYPGFLGSEPSDRNPQDLVPAGARACACSV